MGEETVVRQVQVGQNFAIDLEAIPGAGYMWEIIQRPDAIELVNQEIVSTSKEIGGNSIQRFTLIATQPGVFLVGFGLKRRWEKNPARITIISIQAR